MRRLPVLQSGAPEDGEAEARPRWQWIPIGAGFTVTLWAPVALLVTPLGPAAVVAAFALAALGSGALVGRFGARARAVDAALGPVLGALVGAAITAASVPNATQVASAAFVVLAVSGGLAGGAGSALGRRKRPSVAPRAPLA